MAQPKTNHPAFIGKYQILSPLGAGGLGEVFKAVDPRGGGQIVAVKRLYLKYQQNHRLLGLFHKEMMIHARVDHKHCVKFIEADLTPPNAHIVTTYVDGLSVFDLLKRHGRVPPLIACSIILDLLQGMDHLHCLDIIHSDITPANVLMEKTGRVMLADFGLSCLYEVEDYKGLNVGTPGYLAPERLQHKPITVESDIYGVGIIFYELLTGRKLFAANASKAELLKKMKNIEFNCIQSSQPGLTQNLQKVAKMALSYKHSHRYSSSRDFMRAVYEILKIAQIRYTRRAILQWMHDAKITNLPKQNPIQNIYL